MCVCVCSVSFVTREGRASQERALLDQYVFDQFVYGALWDFDQNGQILISTRDRPVHDICPADV